MKFFDELCQLTIDIFFCQNKLISLYFIFLIIKKLFIEKNIINIHLY